MVDSITSKAITIDGAATRVAAAAPVAAVAPVTNAATTPTSSAPVDIARTDTAQTSGLAQAMAAAPPVDTDRVATIKKAIADGRFPIVPATIADRLIALKLQWSPNDAQ